MESTSHVFHFQMVFFYLVTTGWIIDIRLFEISINRSIISLSMSLMFAFYKIKGSSSMLQLDASSLFNVK